ncbi:uncharacterized protein J7T54_002553 [Emericellopsis cladophorae]|uniref:Enoyl reductase (ER) domain-containing protein n=1 Tax=Emericellopsis cladophorae TaxID=2686198 RepID=A0A9P9Y0D6_9HYPO|nr:uncharacterized protein J7T54_002553 [Emericellopsis cladophorae]KAI6781197.1 hypothetical protein J7T54_002553 [Emericellopsis cladophorae]
MATMKETLVNADLTTTTQKVAVPTPQPGQVRIKVVVSGTNPKDWKIPQWILKGPQNSGDDIAGVVDEVGEGVVGFRKGDRVGAFHEMMEQSGSFAEYAIAWARTTFHIPHDTTFEEVASIPLAATTAGLAVYQRLRLPMPWQQAQKRTPLVVYGGASAVGAYAIKFASLANVHPIVAIAGRGIPYVETLLDKSKGDKVIDYREGEEHVIKELQSIEPNDEGKMHAVDAVSEKGTVGHLAKMKAKDIQIATVLDTTIKPEALAELPKHVNIMFTQVGHVHRVYYPNLEKDVPFDKQFGAILYPFISLGLQEGWFSGHPYEVAPGGLEEGVKVAMGKLSRGEVSAKKMLIRVADDE